MAQFHDDNVQIALSVWHSWITHNDLFEGIGNHEQCDMGFKLNQWDWLKDYYGNLGYSDQEFLDGITYVHFGDFDLTILTNNWLDYWSDGLEECLPNAEGDSSVCSYWLPTYFSENSNSWLDCSAYEIEVDWEQLWTIVYNDSDCLQYMFTLHQWIEKARELNLHGEYQINEFLGITLNEWEDNYCHYGIDFIDDIINAINQGIQWIDTYYAPPSCVTDNLNFCTYLEWSKFANIKMPLLKAFTNLTDNEILDIRDNYLCTIAEGDCDNADKCRIALDIINLYGANIGQISVSKAAEILCGIIISNEQIQGNCDDGEIECPSGECAINVNECLEKEENNNFFFYLLVGGLILMGFK